MSFYLYDKNHHDTFIHSISEDGKIMRNDAAIKQNKLGSWYFHYSGIDLTFGNGNERFGGILIRSIIDLEQQKFIIGPLKLKNYLLNQYDILEQSRDFLKMVSINKSVSSEIVKMTRVGLGKLGDNKYRKSLYRFVLEEIKYKVKKD